MSLICQLTSEDINCITRDRRIIFPPEPGTAGQCLGLTDREAVCLRQPRLLESVEISHRALVISPGPFPAVVGSHRLRAASLSGTVLSQVPPVKGRKCRPTNQAWSLQLGLTRVSLCEPVLFRTVHGPAYTISRAMTDFFHTETVHVTSRPRFLDKLNDLTDLLLSLVTL